jgi:tetratricopeptide (TPR) repeat protein
MDSFTDRLSDYLDDELDAGERALVDRHLPACAECRATLDDLQAVVARAGALQNEPPAADLWPGVAARLDSPRPASRISLFRRVSVPRRFSFTLMQLAAASLTLVVLSGGLVWMARSGDPRADFDPVSANVEVKPANFAEGHYDEAIADLEATLAKGRTTLDPETLRVLEENLGAIDRAIAQCRQALASDPASVYLNSHLADAKQRKLALLRRATALAATAGS